MIYEGKQYPHKRYDGFGEPIHEWREKRIQAIEQVCGECGDARLVRDHRGRLKGSRLKKPTAAKGKSKPSKAARNLEWKQLYESGQSSIQIGRAYNHTATNVAFVLRRMGVVMRGTVAHDDERAAEIVRLRTIEHLTLDAIGERFGITRERARQILVRAGVDGKAAAHERNLATAKKYQPKPPSICKWCVEDFTAEGWTAHQHRMKHNPNPRAAEFVERDRLVAADYAAGLKQRELMAKYGIDPASILRAVRRNGIPLKRPNTARLSTMAASHARADSIAADYAAGMSEREIAAKRGVSDALVYQVAKQRGIWHSARRKAS